MQVGQKKKKITPTRLLLYTNSNSQPQDQVQGTNYFSCPSLNTRVRLSRFRPFRFPSQDSLLHPREERDKRESLLEVRSSRTHNAFWFPIPNPWFCPFHRPKVPPKRARIPVFSKFFLVLIFWRYRVPSKSKSKGRGRRKYDGESIRMAAVLLLPHSSPRHGRLPGIISLPNPKKSNIHLLVCM